MLSYFIALLPISDFYYCPAVYLGMSFPTFIFSQGSIWEWHAASYILFATIYIISYIYYYFLYIFCILYIISYIGFASYFLSEQKTLTEFSHSGQKNSHGIFLTVFLV